MRSTTPTDPELLRQLDEAQETGASVAAAVSIKRALGRATDPEQVNSDARAAVARATEASGALPDDLHVMANIAMVYIEGPAPFIRAVLAQPEVTGATANVRPGEKGAGSAGAPGEDPEP
jgi:hypothetical protein